MIELKNVSKFYSNTNGVSLGLKNINLKFYENEIVAICGESGSGKSTLLNVITKMDTFDDGEIYYNGEETSYFDINDMDLFRKNKVSFIFQNYNIIESYTVLENVMLPLKIQGISFEEAKEKALKVLTDVGLSKRINNKGSELSGGEKQRTVIARALVCDSEILACDEPTGNLDSKTGKEIIKLLSEVAKDKLVLIVTHNFDEVKDVATRKITVKDGEIVEDISLKDVEKHDKKEELGLDEHKVTNKTLFNIAKKNLFSTPRKTFFISFILLLISFSLLLGVVFVKDSLKGFETESPFTAKFSNINYVVNNAYNKMDFSTLSDYKIECEPFESTNPFSIYRDEKMAKVPFISKEAIYLDPDNIKDYYPEQGRYPENDEEIYAIFPTDGSTNAERMFGNDLYLASMYERTSFKLVGYAFSKDVKSGVVLCGNNKAKMFLRYSYTYNNILFAKNDLLKDDSDRSTSMRIYASDKNMIVISKEFESYNFEIESISTIFNRSYSRTVDLELSNLPIVYTDDYEDGIYLSDGLMYENTCECFVYGSKNKVSNAAAKVGCTSFYISSYYEDIDFQSNLTLYLTLLGIVIVIILVYFVTYLILRIAYKSKERDYNILRTLGITKKDMNKIVFSELESLTLLISLVLFFVIKICSLSINNKFIVYFRNLDFTIFIIYFVSVIVLSYFIIRRFNKNMFKNSVNQIFKGREK